MFARVEARNRIYTFISWREKKSEQKILIFRDENWFSKFEIETFSKFFRTKNRKFEIFIFKIDFSKKIFSRKKSVEKYFSTDFFSRKFFREKSILKMQISNFRFFVRKNFKFFSNPKFQNRFSSRKINIFHPNFFFVQGMNVYYRKMSSTTLGVAPLPEKQE